MTFANGLLNETNRLVFRQTGVLFATRRAGQERTWLENVYKRGCVKNTPQEFLSGEF